MPTPVQKYRPDYSNPNGEVTLPRRIHPPAASPSPSPARNLSASSSLTKSTSPLSQRPTWHLRALEYISICTGGFCIYRGIRERRVDLGLAGTAGWALGFLFRHTETQILTADAKIAELNKEREGLNRNLRNTIEEKANLTAYSTEFEASQSETILSLTRENGKLTEENRSLIQQVRDLTNEIDFLRTDSTKARDSYLVNKGKMSAQITYLQRLLEEAKKKESSEDFLLSPPPQQQTLSGASNLDAPQQTHNRGNFLSSLLSSWQRSSDPEH